MYAIDVTSECCKGAWRVSAMGLEMDVDVMKRMITMTAESIVSTLVLLMIGLA